MRIIYYKVTTGKRQYPAPRIGITIYKNKLSILKGSTVMNCLKFGGLFLKSVLDKGYSSNYDSRPFMTIIRPPLAS